MHEEKKGQTKKKKERKRGMGTCMAWVAKEKSIGTSDSNQLIVNCG